MTVALAPVVGTLVTSILSPGQSPGAVENEADNTVLYNRAIAGDSQALINLATVSGGQGTSAGIPGAGNPSTTSLPIWRPGIGSVLQGGWGSTNAELDAVQKYQQAIAALRGNTVGATFSNILGQHGDIVVFAGIGLALVFFTMLVLRRK